MKKIFSTSTLLIVALLCFGQTNLEMATDAFQAQEYTNALDLFQKALRKPDKKTDVATVKFKVAECYRFLGQYDEALNWYEQAKSEGYNDPNYLYQEGSIYLQQGNYAQAQTKLETFLQQKPNDKDATRLLNNCRLALTTTDDKSIYTVQNETALNTAFSDYCAYPVKSQLLFTSSRLVTKDQEVYTYDGQGLSSIYTASYQKENKTWSQPTPVATLNSEANNGVLSYCEKTQTAYFTRCNDRKSKSGLCGIWQSTYNESSNTWSAPSPIKLASEVKADMEQPAISADGEKLYFASRMEGGQGGSDIWMMTKSGDLWGSPQNLGTAVNTEFDEMFPVENNGALYFSSEGFTGYGGLDLFYTQNQNGTWSKPANLKPPFNSNGDDFFITYKPDGGGFFTSTRSGGLGKDDIYSFFLTPVNLTVKGRVTDLDDAHPMANATVYLTTADGHTDSTMTNSNGEYSFTLAQNQDYKINVSNPGYFGDSRKLTTQGEKFSKEFSKATGYNYDFSIKRIPKTEIKIDNIYYDYDSYTLREESKPSLDKLVKLLDDTPDALVQINSHTDERGKADYNIKLSDERAKSVVDYLVAHGISQGRLSWKGFGFSQPVIKGAKTEEEHQMNRRTTFQVINQ